MTDVTDETDATERQYDPGDPATWDQAERNIWACQECGGTTKPSVPPWRRHDTTCSLASSGAVPEGAPTREVLLHLNVDVEEELEDGDAVNRAVGLALEAAARGRAAFEGLIALADPQ